MGFFHQLRLLLWKNFTLKKRSPFVLMFEVSIPLVLFIILLLIRRKLPANPVGTSTYGVKPLPSAGVISFMQMFCEGGARDKHGFPTGHASQTTTRLLQQLQTVAENHNFFDPGFTPSQMEDIPQVYRAVIEDPAFLHDQFANATDLSLSDLLNSEYRVEQFLVHNLSIPIDDARVLENVTIHVKELYRFLFGEEWQAMVEGLGPGRRRRSATDLADLWSLSQSLVPTLALPLPASWLQKQVMEALQGLGWGAGDLARGVTGDMAQQLEAAILHQVLERSPLPGNQSLLQTLLQLGELSQRMNVPVSLSPAQLARLIKIVLLSPSSLRDISCNADLFGQLLIPSQSINTSAVKDLQRRLCQLNVSQDIQLSQFLQDAVSDTVIVNTLHLKPVNLTATASRVQNFVGKMRRFVQFQQELRELATLVAMLPLDNLTPDNSSSSPSPLPPNTTLTTPLPSNDTKTTPKPTPPPKHHHSGYNTGLLKIWGFMQMAVCGKEMPVVSPTSASGDGPQQMDFDLDSIHLSSHQERMLGIILHVLYSNPKILYSPVNTSADNVMQKANATFAFVDLISNYARKWLNISTEIRQYLEQPHTRANLRLIQRMQSDLQEHRGFLGMLFRSPPLSDFLNESVPSVEEYEGRLGLIDHAARAWLSMLNGISLNVFQGFATEDEMLDYFLHRAYQDNVSVIAGVVFERMEADGSLPPHVRYKIRQNATFTPSTKFARKQTWYPGPGSGDYPYYQFGFVWVQDMMERAIIDVQVGRDVVEPGTFAQQFPYPCYMYDQFMFMIEHVMPLCLTISWVYTVAMLVQNIVYEKEQRLKEVMKMMGLSNAVHWCAWFLTSYCQMTITVGVLTAMLKYGRVLPHSDPWVIFLVLQIYSMAVVSFSFLISVLYSKAKVAAACAGIIYFLSYVPYMYIAIKEDIAGDRIPAFFKSMASLFSTTAFGLGAKYFAFYEEMGVGVQWNNIYLSPVEDDEYNLFMVTLMMILDSFLYAILVWYIEHIHPGSYGLPKPWYFPFTRTYWCGGSGRGGEECCCNNPLRLCLGGAHYLSVLEEDQACAMAHDQDPDHARKFETVPGHLSCGVHIENLTKVYKRGKKTAVKNLTLDLYEGQITSFLGHNGAGKTTTMSMLTGLIPITSGYATIYGLDIRSDMDVIRQSLGMCPQHNVLFDKLTVEEHLWLYSRLKGMKHKDTMEEMNRMIEDLGLPDKRHSSVDCLSGGMQRKLSVAIAFVGGSRTVILDEPTAGVDPYARRAIWDLLVKYKPGRTILLSTHHMDEADILGDRIAIISNGQLKCCGSPIFLKNNIGMGYHLKLAKAQDSLDLTEQDEEQVLDSRDISSRKFHSECQESKVTEFIQRSVPTAFLVAETLRELHYILPFEEAKKGNFEKLFTALESDLHSLKVSSFGVMDTTLEEVFLKVTETSVQEEQALKEEEKEMEMLNAASHAPAMGTTTLGGDDDNDNDSADFNLNTSDTAPLLGSTANSSMNAVGGAFGPLTDELELGDILGATGGGDSPETPSPPQWSPLHINQDPAKCLEGLKGVGTLGPRMRLLNHFRAVIIKRFHYITRNWRSLFSQIILPAIFVAIAMTVALAAPSVDDLPPMELSPSQYFNLTQPRGNFIPFTDERMYHPSMASEAEAGPRQLIDTLRMPSGIGATCVLLSPFNSSFDSDWLGQLNYTSSTFELLSRYFQPECSAVFVPGLHYQPYIPDPAIEPPDDGNSSFLPEDPGYSDKHYYPQCHCAESKAGYICSSQPYPKPPAFHVVTRDILQNITGQLVSDFLLYTTYEYRQHRYGALSFGLQQHYIPPTFGRDAPTLYRKLAVRNVAKVWFNHKGFHSMAVYLNSVNNAILRANLPKSKGNPAAYGITAINHPWNDTNNKLSTMDYIMEGSDVLIAMFIIAAMSFVPASFVVFLIMERSTKAKHLQFVSGINPVMYWIGNYVWDMCNYVIPALMCILILVIFQIPAYVSTSNLPGIIALFLMYGWSITPVMYPASFMFKEPSTAYICLIVINLFTGITCIVSSFLLEIFSYDKDLNRVNNIIKFVFMMFPNYCLGRGLMDVAFNEYKNEYYFKTGQYDMMRSPMEWDIVPHYLVAMAVIGLVFFLLTLLCEHRFFIKPRHCKVPRVPLAEEDEDVAAERRRVLKGQGRKEVLFLENLTKVYVTRKLGRHLAVDRLCLGVPSGECFGLLGVNGAGKTTLFKMLTGELRPTAGSALLNGHSVVRDLKKVQSLIGYCPQFDALFDELTAREHLQLYCRLRGIPPKDEKRVVEWALSKLGLTAYADKLSGTFSGGCKRKLSTAIALIGEPAVIFMDEPTTGMDPHSRRFLWDLILGQIAVGRSIVLTSHSMEECEALCTRLAIMVNGRFRCLGSAQHLKSRYGQGYTFSLRVKGPDLEHNSFLVRRHLERKLPEAVLKEQHVNILQYELPTSHVSLALLFPLLEDCTRDLPIEDYSVSQNTLDNVFINFVKQQMEIVRDDMLNACCDAASGTPQDGDAPLLMDNLAESGLENDDDDCILHFDQPNGNRLSLLPMSSADSQSVTA